MSDQTIAEQAQEEMWSGARPGMNEIGGSKPTARQIYAIARLFCERAGKQWPGTKAEASTLIADLRSGGRDLRE